MIQATLQATAWLLLMAAMDYVTAFSNFESSGRRCCAQFAANDAWISLISLVMTLHLMHEHRGYSQRVLPRRPAEYSCLISPAP